MKTIYNFFFLSETLWILSIAPQAKHEIYEYRDLATWIESDSQCNYAADYLGENKLASARGLTKSATGQWQWHLRFGGYIACHTSRRDYAPLAILLATLCICMWMGSASLNSPQRPFSILYRCFAERLRRLA